MKPQTNRLLIVDDNEMNRDMLARRLARKGYDVLVANGAHDLVENVKQDGIDLVLLDIEMPEITGLDALRILRKVY
jgi:adenylate cyclase